MNKILASGLGLFLALAQLGASTAAASPLTFPTGPQNEANEPQTRKPDFEGLVDLENGQKLFVIEYKAQPGEPTVVLLNGLTYDTKPWKAMVSVLAKTGIGILVYDPRGMGKTLEATGPVKEIIPIAQQVEDLDYLLRNRGVQTADLAGLSYGGALGIAYAQVHPERVGRLVVMAPFVRPLEQQDSSIKQKIKLHRMMRPSDKRTDDELYDHYLKEIVYQTYPIFEPAIKEHPWRLEAVFQMVRGVRKFLGAEAVKSMAALPVHLVVAGKDEYVPAKDLNEFWGALRPDQKASRITLRGSKHKIPESVPNFAAGWILRILGGDVTISGGREFDGNPANGTAVSRDAKVTDLPTDAVGILF